MSKEIKPCPFCGGEAMISSLPASFNNFDRYYKVKCMSCGATIDKRDNEQEVVDAWNRRADNGTDK